MNNHPLIPAVLLSIIFLGNVGCEKANPETAIGATPKPGLESQSQPNGQVPLMGTNGATPNPDLESQYQRIRAEIQARQAPVRPPSTVFIVVSIKLGAWGSPGLPRPPMATSNRCWGYLAERRVAMRLEPLPFSRIDRQPAFIAQYGDLQAGEGLNHQDLTRDRFCLVNQGRSGES